MSRTGQKGPDLHPRRHPHAIQRKSDVPLAPGLVKCVPYGCAGSATLRSEPHRDVRSGGKDASPAYVGPQMTGRRDADDGGRQDASLRLFGWTKIVAPPALCTE